MRASARGTLAIVAAVAAAALAAPAVASANMIVNGSFEKPAVAGPSQSFVAPSTFGKCVSGTAIHCWYAGTGTVDVVTSAGWQPKAGNQSFELNGGVLAAEIVQSMLVTPGQQYKVSFWLAGNPAATDNVGVAVYWGNIDGHGGTTSTNEHDFSFFPIGTAGNMGWTKHTFVETATDGEARLYFRSNTILPDPDWGPTIDKVSVKAL